MHTGRMHTLTIALLQLSGHSADPVANAARGEIACREARALGADIALFPEMWSIGYAPCPPDPAGRATWAALAVPHDGPFLERFRALARELEMAVAITYLEEWPGRPRNALTLFDRHGREVFTYAKVHTCTFDWEAELTPGDAFRAGDLDTAAGIVRAGAMICFDREFPESARVLALLGAEVVLVPNACDLEQNRMAQFRARAFENMAAMVMANYPGPGFGGRSCAFDGMAFERDGTSRDMLLVEAGGGDQIALARIDMEQLRAYRRHEVWGARHRRPAAYEAITLPGAPGTNHG